LPQPNWLKHKKCIFQPGKPLYADLQCICAGASREEAELYIKRQAPQATTFDYFVLYSKPRSSTETGSPSPTTQYGQERVISPARSRFFKTPVSANLISLARLGHTRGWCAVRIRGSGVQGQRRFEHFSG